MNPAIVKNVLLVATLQAVVAGAAAVLAGAAAGTAALASAAIGILAVGRYVAVASFAASLGRRGPAAALSLSAWILGFLALIVAIAAVAARAKPSLPWALAA